MSINIQQDRIICRSLKEVNKMVELFNKLIRPNPTTWMASRI
jgi:16S rRNA G527 N7-methylase RsmG